MVELTFTVADLLGILDTLGEREEIALSNFREVCDAPEFDVEAANYQAGVADGVSSVRGCIYELFVRRLGEVSSDS